MNIPISQLNALKQQYPGQAAQLDELVRCEGPRAVINLDDVTPQVRERLGVPLSDELYRLAYRLREDRFFSYYLQVNEILKLPKSRVHDILEIGPGVGIFEALINNYDYRLLTMDVRLHHSPTFQGDVLNIPIKPKSVDLVCAFEVLEHLPSKYFQPALRQMARCARHYVYLSLPCPTSSVYLRLKLRLVQRFVNRLSFEVNWFGLLPTKLADRDEEALMQREDRHNPHYWEVNRKSFPKTRILREIEVCHLDVMKAFHNPFFAYHWFILCEVR